MAVIVVELTTIFSGAEKDKGLIPQIHNTYAQRFILVHSDTGISFQAVTADSLT